MRAVIAERCGSNGIWSPIRAVHTTYWHNRS